MNSPPIHPKKILIVDDDQIILSMLQFVLKKGGYEIVTTKDGVETLTLVRKEKPDLILLDLSFPLDPSNIGGPLVDGFFIIDRLHKTPGAEKIPIVIISSTNPEEYKERALASGVITCLRKPINRQEILDTVKSVLKIFEN